MLLIVMMMHSIKGASFLPFLSLWTEISRQSEQHWFHLMLTGLEVP